MLRFISKSILYRRSSLACHPRQVIRNLLCTCWLQKRHRPVTELLHNYKERVWSTTGVTNYKQAGWLEVIGKWLWILCYFVENKDLYLMSDLLCLCVLYLAGWAVAVPYIMAWGCWAAATWASSTCCSWWGEGWDWGVECWSPDCKGISDPSPYSMNGTSQYRQKNHHTTHTNSRIIYSVTNRALTIMVKSHTKVVGGDRQAGGKMVQWKTKKVTKGQCTIYRLLLYDHAGAKYKHIFRKWWGVYI